MATVKLGDRGAEVRRLQTLLTSALRARLKVDGHFGARTQQAVVQLQKMKSASVMASPCAYLVPRLAPSCD